MKKYWIIAAIIISTAAAVSATWLTRQATPNPANWLAEELHLSANQRTQVLALDREFSGTCDKYCAALCTARIELAEELQKSNQVTPKIEELLGKMQTAQTASERETVNHLFKIKALLTPEQQHRYVELVSQKLCSHCEHHSHSSDTHQ